MPFYRTILKQAWNTAWRTKYLWFFGIFASLVGSGGEYELMIRGISKGELLENFEQLVQAGFFSTNTLRNIKEIISNDPATFAIVLALLGVIAVLFLFLVWIVIVSQVAIVQVTAKRVGGKETSFQEAINYGVSKFWPALWLNASAKAVIYLVILMMFGLLSVSGIGSGVAYTTAFLIALAIAVLTSFVFKYAVAQMVVKDENLRNSFFSGLKLFRENWIVSIEMALMLFVVNIVSVFTSLLISLMLYTPLIYLSYIFSQLAGTPGAWIGIFLSLAILLGLVMFIASLSAVFQISSWTVLYSELVSRGVKSKFLRLFSKNNT